VHGDSSWCASRAVSTAMAAVMLWRPTGRCSRLLTGTIGSSVLRRHFCDDKAIKALSRYPPRYFDFKAFRKALKEKKESIGEADMREVRREYALPPPEGWTVITFLERIKFGDGAEDVANLFEHWKDFISMSPKDITRIVNISVTQSRKLSKYITLFNHGLWPKQSPDEFYNRFGGKKLAREGEPWTPQDDERLLEKAEFYDVNFGDPWIYLSWDLQRREDDVRERYIELVEKPRERSTRCELAITKSSRPLHMHRKFRMLPADLYIVPSEENFPLAPKRFTLPAAFAKYRQDDVF